MAAFDYDLNYDYSIHPNISIGKMNQICKFCQALEYITESPGICCANGKMKLPLLEVPPEPLQSYFAATTPNSRHFLENIRKYNSCFQMTSFGPKLISEDGFMPTFKIQGQIYHKIGSFLPTIDNDAKFLQIHFMGNENLEINQRNQITSGTKHEITLDLQIFLRKHNNLIKMFKTAFEQMPSDEYKIIIKPDRKPINEHERRFNVPTVNEVAIVYKYHFNKKL